MNSFFARRFVIQAVFISVAIILLLRLFYIQVIDKSYFLSANNNVLRKVIVYPARGVILDRKGKILVQNEPVYDIMVIPHEVKPFDTLEFCKLVGIDKPGFDKRFKKARNYSPYRASVFEKQLSARMYATFQEKLFEYPGFFVQKRSVRRYPDSTAAQFLGYIGEVTDKEIEESDGFYQPGDYIGRSGVERSYEELLRGQRGVQNLMVDAFNRPKGHFANGKYDTLAVAGDKLISSLDKELQKLGEKLMQNKIGSIVAIEPGSGEILAFVSSPTYDPNEMVGRERGNNYIKYLKHPYKPLLIRPIQAYYSPGSSFKPVDALIALQEGIITPSTSYYCPGYYMAGSHRVKCEHVDGPTALSKGIAMSCNTYFCYILNDLLRLQGSKKIKLAYENWKEHANKFGFGVKLGIDLPNEKKGIFPSSEYYDKVYNSRWNSNTIISLAIGQGELNATPLQMANVECIIANKGYYYKPHLIKAIGDKKVIKKEFIVKNHVGVEPKYFEPVIDGMQQVVDNGTATASKIPGVVFCGKTGTVQNSHGKNHSVFVGFAPRENPKIAIAVIVENGGYGASWAAPIASFMVEKYLKDSITRRPSGIDVNRYINANLLPALPGLKKESQEKTPEKKQKQDTVKKAVSLQKAYNGTGKQKENKS
ncbi:penicillin-binding protein 2 [Rubrolithibacter danxiaensis]|uniref:penicillin-binding protein 2 n=1 Tax=Rubrolithibacter danxiaensis TaxID=3390805 RepID=UPI003BF8875A